MVRPSTRSTVKASLLTLTECARASCFSTTEELIPTLDQALVMLLHELANPIELAPAKASAALERNRFEPEFSNHVFAPDVNMRRFASIRRDKEKAIGTYVENRGHPIAARYELRLARAALNTQFDLPRSSTYQGTLPAVVGRAGTRGAAVRHPRRHTGKGHQHQFFRNHRIVQVYYVRRAFRGPVF